jgi:DNA-directed RNA polymerase II subunit RPB1
MAVPKQIVAPQSNKPCMGIVQDALLGINRLTSRDTFVEKHVLMNILMFVDYNIEQGLPQPAILKPKPLWSAINAEYGGDYRDEKNRNDRKDTKVIVQNGQLIEGILGKGTVGNAASSLIHLVWKDLGP